MHILKPAQLSQNRSGHPWYLILISLCSDVCRRVWGPIWNLHDLKWVPLPGVKSATAQSWPHLLVLRLRLYCMYTDIDIFTNCDWVDTQWQQYSTIYTQTVHRTTYLTNTGDNIIYMLIGSCVLEIIKKCREMKSSEVNVKSEVESLKWCEKLSNIKCSEVK